MKFEMKQFQISRLMLFGGRAALQTPRMPGSCYAHHMIESDVAEMRWHIGCVRTQQVDELGDAP